MFKLRFLNTIFLIVIVFSFFGNFCFAYDGQTTHPNLSDITVELYNLQAKSKILQSEKYWIKKGSMDEDSGVRSINHFYDPIYNRTWKLGGVENIVPEVISKVWLNDQERQASYDTVFLASLKIMTRSYLESSTNQTYNRAIYEYLKGNKKEAFYALGHTLHLLQDLTSVPHTRADTHTIGSDKSNYEITSGYKNSDDFIKLFEKLKVFSIIKRSDINDYFYNVALYTNNNFYSDDTIMSIDYSKPEIFQTIAVDFVNNVDKYYVLGWDNEIQNTYKLVKKIGRDWKISEGFNKYELDDPLVFEDYWSRLSKKAVLEGAGLIDLFFKDVEKKRNDPQFFAMMEQKHGVSFFENLVGDISRATQYLLGLFQKQPEDIIIQPPNTTNISTSTSRYINNNYSSSTISLITSTTKPTTTTKKLVTTTSTTKKLVTTTTKKTTTTTKKAATTTTKKINSGGGGSSSPVSKCDFDLSSSDILNQNKKVIFNEIAWMGSLNNFSDEWIELKNISNEKVDMSLWEIINNGKSIKIVIPNGTILNPQEMYLLERTDDDTVLHVKSDLIFVGAIKNEDEEIRLLNKDCVIMDLSKADSKWSAGSSETKRTMERKNDFSWYTSSANCINGICGTPKSENSLYVDDYNKPESTTTTTTTLMTTTTTTIPDNSSSTTTTTIPTEEMGEIKKVVFSEVKISGENAYDEFIELYNPTDEDINLTDWSIKQKTVAESNLLSNDFLLDKIIPSKGYFLIVNKQEGKYKGNVLADSTFNSDSYSLVDNQVIILYDNYQREIDRIGWGGERITNSDCEENCLLNIESNKSFERKANENSNVDTMSDGLDELAGNSYDSNNNLTDFVTRENPDPQNSQSLKEPREQDSENNNNNENEGGGEQSNNWGDGFSLQDVKFYYLNDKKERAFLKFNIEKYPFWNVNENNDDKWRSMVFYLNSPEDKMSALTRERNNNDVGYAGWQVTGNNTQVLLIKYKTCKSGFNTKYGASFDSSLILPYNQDMSGGSFLCDDYNVSDYYGAPNSIAYNYNSGHNDYIEVEVIGVLGPDYERNYNIKDLFKEGDYITIGFYKGDNDYTESYLDTPSLIFEDNTKYFLSTDEFKTIEIPKNLVVVYDQENYRYNLSWDKIEDEEGVEYNICVGDTIDNVGSTNCYGNDIIWNEGKWNKSVLLENIPYNSGKVFFGVKAINNSYELVSNFSNIVEDNVYEMPKRIDQYVSNVNWSIKNGRMVVELDLDKIGKFSIAGNADHYIHELLASWDYRNDIELNTYANPNVELSNGAISDYNCGGQKNNSRLRLFSYNNAMTKGHKEFLVKFLSHPLLKDLYLYNPEGLTLDDLNKLVRSESNPDGILNSLSDMFLTLNYGVRNEMYCGYWLSDNNFTSFTPDTNNVSNQVRYGFNNTN